MAGAINGIQTVILVDSSNAPLSSLPSGASESHLGEVGSPIAYIDVTLVLDTNIYASGDVLVVPQVVTNAMRVNDGLGVLQSIIVVDEDDQGAALDLVFFSSASASLGTINAAVSISDADARTIEGLISIAAADFVDLGGVRVATKTATALAVKAISGTRNLYVGAISRGTGTYTASGIRLRLGFLQG